MPLNPFRIRRLETFWHKLKSPQLRTHPCHRNWWSPGQRIPCRHSNFPCDLQVWMASFSFPYQSSQHNSERLKIEASRRRANTGGPLSGGFCRRSQSFSCGGIFFAPLFARQVPSPCYRFGKNCPAAIKSASLLFLLECPKSDLKSACQTLQNSRMPLVAKIFNLWIFADWQILFFLFPW